MVISPSAFLNQVELSNTIRRLWVDNSQWIRALVYSVFFNIGDRAAIEVRLNRVADQFAELFTRYYGPEAGDRIRVNYLMYIQALEGMIEAYRNNDATAVQGYREQLYQIADNLAQYYAQLNRYWDQATLQVMLYELINNTESEIAHIGTSDFAQEIEAHDRLMDQAYRLSDELTTGINRQFRV